VARTGEERGVHRVLVGKPEGMRPLGRPRRRWEDNIKMDLQEVGGGCGDRMELAQTEVFNSDTIHYCRLLFILSLISAPTQYYFT